MAKISVLTAQTLAFDLGPYSNFGHPVEYITYISYIPW